MKRFGVMKLWHKFAIGAFFLYLSWINFIWTIVFAIGMISGIGVMIALQIAEDKQKPKNL
jgi:hypothetical protein